MENEITHNKISSLIMTVITHHSLSKQIENQILSVTEQPIRFLRLQGIARDWSKHNEHSRNIFSVHGFLRLSVNA